MTVTPHAQPGPRPVQAALDEFCREAIAALGEQLVSIVLYGGVSAGEYAPASSDVNVMVILRPQAATDAALLDRLVEPVRQAARAIGLTLLLQGEDELAGSLDVFPSKYLDIRARHKLLHGRDVVSGLQIPRDHLRLRSEQELRNLLMRLRQAYLYRSAGVADQLGTLLSSAVSDYVRTLRTLVYLTGGTLHTSKQETIADAQRCCGLEPATPLRLLDLKNRRITLSQAETRTLFFDFLRLLAQAIGLADRLKEEMPAPAAARR